MCNNIFIRINVQHSPYIVKKFRIKMFCHFNNEIFTNYSIATPTCMTLPFLKDECTCVLPNIHVHAYNVCTCTCMIWRPLKFTTLVKFYSTEYFCNAKVHAARLGNYLLCPVKIFSPVVLHLSFMLSWIRKLTGQKFDQSICMYI